MKHLLNNLSEEEKNAIRRQHKDVIEINTSRFHKLLEAKLGDSKPLLSEQKQKMFDMISQKLLRDRGFKDRSPAPFDFEKTIPNPGGGETKVMVVATECTKYPQYVGMKIYVNGKEYNNGNYERCPDTCWTVLDKIIGYEWKPKLSEAKLGYRKPLLSEQELDRELPPSKKGILGHLDGWYDERDYQVNPDEFDYDEEIEFGPDDFEDYIAQTETDFPENKWSFNMKGREGDRSPGKQYWDIYQKHGPIKLRRKTMKEQVSLPTTVPTGQSPDPGKIKKDVEDCIKQSLKLTDVMKYPNCVKLGTTFASGGDIMEATKLVNACKTELQNNRQDASKKQTEILQCVGKKYGIEVPDVSPLLNMMGQGLDMLGGIFGGRQ